MKKIIDLNIYKNNKLTENYPTLPVISTSDSLTFFINDVKSKLDKTKFIRENNEFLFKLDITNNTCTYLLKENNLLFDILVEKISYIEENNCIILKYKIASDEEEFKIEIIKKGDNNE